MGEGTPSAGYCIRMVYLKCKRSFTGPRPCQIRPLGLPTSSGAAFIHTRGGNTQRDGPAHSIASAVVAGPSNVPGGALMASIPA